jgi:hypothetical protein
VDVDICGRCRQEINDVECRHELLHVVDVDRSVYMSTLEERMSTVDITIACSGCRHICADVDMR